MKNPENKICSDAVSLRLHIDALETFKNTKLKVGYTTGVFDIMHKGHMHFLREARKQCHFLIVSVASDEHVHLRKGSPRPYQPREDRANALANLDYVVLSFALIMTERVKSLLPHLMNISP